jgi:hypothetical protein
MGFNIKVKQCRTSESVTKDRWPDGDGVVLIPKNLQIRCFDLKVFSNFRSRNRMKSHLKRSSIGTYSKI